MQKSTYLHKFFMTIGHLEHEIWTDKGGLLRMIQNGQQDKKKPNYLFILSLNLNLKLNDCGHAHKSSQSCQKSKSNIVHYDNYPTTQVSIVQPLKEKKLNSLSHIYACLLHIFRKILLWVDVGAGVGVSKFSFVP